MKFHLKYRGNWTFSGKWKVYKFFRTVLFQAGAQRYIKVHTTLYGRYGP